MTAERTTHEGTVIITQVSKSVVEASDDLEVQVDGEAAVQASSTSELKGAIGSDASKYMVQSTSEASASATVLVGVNHFSERQVSMTDSSSGSDGSDGSTPTATDGSDSSDDGDSNDGDDGSDDSTNDGDDSSNDDGENPSGNDDSNPDATSTSGQPGFGPVVALAALAGLVVALRSRA